MCRYTHLLLRVRAFGSIDTRCSFAEAKGGRPEQLLVVASSRVGEYEIEGSSQVDVPQRIFDQFESLCH